MTLTLPVLIGLTINGCFLSPAQAADKQEDLVFEGTVTSIKPSPIPNSIYNWIITMRVDRVVKGRFDGKKFQFRIHSPALSGLKVREKRTVEAKRTADGYTVDQYQWTNPPVVPDGRGGG